MKKFLAIIIFFSLIFMFSCKKKSGKGFRIEKENSIKNVYNPAEPARGNKIIQLKKIMEIDSLTVDKNNPPIFSSYAKDKHDNIFISGRGESKIYKFNSEGEFIKSFVRKGEGPGELTYIGDFGFIEDKIWIYGSRKLVWYDKNGNFIREKRLKNYFFPIKPINEDRFLGNLFTKADRIKNRKRVFGLLDINENIVYNYIERKGFGTTSVTDGKMVFSFSAGGVTPDFSFDYDKDNKILYYAAEDEYKIYVSSLEGKLIKTVQRDFERKSIDFREAEKVINMFKNIDDTQKKIIKNNLPGKLCAVVDIKILPREYFLVRSINSIGDYQNDIFDNEGKFVFTIEFPEGTDIKGVNYYKDGIAAIVSSGERNSYVEYETSNFPELY